MLSGLRGDRRGTDTCLTRNNLARRPSSVKYGAMPPQDNELTERFVQWIKAEMGRREWSQAKLARHAKLREDVVSRTLNRETDPQDATLQALAGAFKMTVSEMIIAVADSLRNGQEKPPRMPQDQRSPEAPSSITGVLGEGGSKSAQSVLEHLRQVPDDVQRAIIAAAFARGLEHQELHGGGLLRAAMGICRELRRMGYAGVAKEIEADLMRAVFEQVEPDGKP